MVCDQKLYAAAKLVEDWWLEEGFLRLNGAPAAMFALREALRPQERGVTLTELIGAADKLSFAAQTSGGVAGRDEYLVAAIDNWVKVRDAFLGQPVSPRETAEGEDISLSSKTPTPTGEQ